MPCPSSSLVGENPQIIGRKLEKRVAAAGREIAITTKAQRTELEQLFLAVAQEHSGDDFSAHAVVAGAVGDPGALEANDAGRRIADLERTARGAPQFPALAFEQSAAVSDFSHLARQMVVAT